MKKSIIVSGIEEISVAAKTFWQFAGEHKKFAFFGPMGSGKTTFIKALCEEKAVVDYVTSPSFSIINEYCGIDDERFFHIDFYRIEEVEEVYDMGYEEYFFDDHYCFVEWPEKVADLIPEHFLQVHINVQNDLSREFVVSGL